jgi:hypothetical protein
MKDPRIFLFWVVVLESFSFYLCAISIDKGPRASLVVCTLIWLGLLIGISFTESWLKFKSKLMERQVGLDIGRLVFDGLNTLETALCVTMLTQLFQFETLPYSERIWGIPVTMTVTLLLQVLYLTPRLELRSMYIASEELSKKKHATRKEEEVYKEFKAYTTLRKIPSTHLHSLYIVLEMMKVVMLFKYAEILLVH